MPRAELTALRRSQLVTHLAQLFGSFEASEAQVLEELESEVEMLTLAGGETLFRQGDRPDAAFIVMSGRLRVVQGVEGKERVLNEVGRGETVGEIALLTDEPRSATVFAVRDTELARISQNGFLALIERRPKSLRPLAHVSASCKPASRISISTFAHPASASCSSTTSRRLRASATTAPWRR